jgi:two-component sensor histidine kinase/DNA-binding response OmpR family regulator
MKAELTLPVETSAPGAGRILIVDDDARNLKLLDAILIAASHHPICAPSGEEALKLAKEMNPDLILLDIMMPMIDGYEILRELKAAPETVDIPVVMVTSLHDQASKVRALEEGADDFLTKPVSKPELIARVRSLLKVKAYNDSLKDHHQVLEKEVANKTASLKRHSTQLEILNQASYMINSNLDVSSILRSVVIAAHELWESDGGAAGIVDDGELLFKEWYWKGERHSGESRCKILRDLKNMPSFMEFLSCEDKRCGETCFVNTSGCEIKERLAIPIYDRQRRIQACLLLFNPETSPAERKIHDDPLPGLIAIAATALDNARNVMELKDKEEALQASLKEKNLLLKEIHHRVKNNLQAIVGLLETHLGAIENSRDKEIFQKGQSLAMSMAMIHELLYSTEDYTKINFGENTRKLVDHALVLYPDRAKNVQINYDLEELYLNTDTAIPLSLVINELVSNALVHAFPDGRSGTISISMRKIGRGGFEMKIADDGIGMSNTSEGPSRQTLGLNLVHSLMENLHGTMKVKASGGTRYVIRFKEYFECDNLELG